MSGALRRFNLLAALAAGAWLGVAPAHAQNATWVGGNAGDPHEWVENNNWTPATVPTGTATFGAVATTTAVANAAGAVTIATVNFTLTALAYTIAIDNAFTLNGNGVVNNSANTQTFNIASGKTLTAQNSSSASGGTGAVQYNNAGGNMVFNTTSTAGSANVFSSFNATNATVTFNNTSSAGSATFTSNPANFPTYTFNDTSTAANAKFVLVDATLIFNNSSNAGSAVVTMPNVMHPGNVIFHNTSSAGNANITNVGVDVLGSSVTFFDASTAGNATITNNINPSVPSEGGVLIFGVRNGGGTDTANAGTATITNNQFGSTSFFGFTSGANATIINNNGGSTAFEENSTAANAHITNNNGGGLIFFSGAPTAGNAVITNNAGGTVEFGLAGFIPFIIDTATAGNATITNSGSVIFSSATTAGNAQITNNNGGFVGFSELSSAGNAVITSTGIVSFVGSSTAANATITNNAGGQLSFGSFTETFPGGIPTFNPFIGTGSAGNAIIINNNGGSTTFFNQSTTGTASITNNAGGALFFANAGGSPVDPDASTARVISNAGGTVDISQVNTGVSIGSLSGAGNVFLGSKVLTLGNLNSNDTIGGVIADGGMGAGSGGELIKIGSGFLTLSGINTYTGPTFIDNGILNVLGSIATSSIVQVNSGGTLAGTGTVATTIVNSGGMLAPGNGNVGTLTVAGNLTFKSGSIFLVDVTPTTASKVQVNGTANLAGTVEAVFLPGSYLTNAYTILSATGGRTGTFDNLVTVDLPAFLTAKLVYDPNDVMLVTLTSNLNRPGLTQNQAAVAATLDNSFNSGRGTLSGLSFVAANQLPAALNALSGEGTSGTQETAFGAGDLFLSTMMEQGQFWRSGTGATGTAYAPLGYASETAQAPVFKAMPLKAPLVTEPVYRAWFAGFDGTWHLDGQAEPGSAALRQSTVGGAAGLDYQVNPNLLVGVAAGGSSSTFSVPDRATSGTLEGAHIGTYGVGRWGPWYAAGALAFNAFDNNYTRTIAGVGPTELATGKFNSDMLSGRFELGYRQTFSGFAVTPFAAVQFAELWQSGYSETSTTLAGAPGALGLTYSAQTVSSLPTFLGAQFDTRVTLQNGTAWLPYARLSWVHEFEPTRDINAGFITLPVTNFTVFGPSAARDAARVDLGSKLVLKPNAALFASFDGEFSDRSQMYAGKGGLKVTW